MRAPTQWIAILPALLLFASVVAAQPEQPEQREDPSGETTVVEPPAPRSPSPRSPAPLEVVDVLAPGEVEEILDDVAITDETAANDFSEEPDPEFGEVSAELPNELLTPAEPHIATPLIADLEDEAAAPSEPLIIDPDALPENSIVVVQEAAPEVTAAPTGEPLSLQAELANELPVPQVNLDETIDDTMDGVGEYLPGLPGHGSPWNPLLLLLLVMALSAVTRMARDQLPERGLIPSVLTYVHVALRVLAVVFAIAFVARILPRSMAPALTWMLVAAAVAVGFSSWYLIRDVLAWLVITVERRVLPGTWVSGADFVGTVERVGPRATWIRDSRGHRVAVPNHEILQAPVVTGRKGKREIEVRLRIEEDDREEVRESATWLGIREMLRDATLASPWVAPSGSVDVLQDPDDPVFWNVRAELLDVGFGPRFEGELHERAMEMIKLAKRDLAIARELSRQPQGEDAGDVSA